jgi:hypothetical protein
MASSKQTTEKASLKVVIGFDLCTRFDDERGDYRMTKHDHINYRYEVLGILGRGSFGQVVRCMDHVKGVLMAIKVIRNKKRFHQQAQIEVAILQRLQKEVRPLMAFRVP